jgi:hypothetical protein
MTETSHWQDRKVARGVVRRGLPPAAALALILAAASAAAPAAPAAFAQGGSIGAHRTYVNPFPQTDRYHVYVIGDSLADGLAQGLEDAVKKESSVAVFNYARPSSGMARRDSFDWTSEAAQLIKDQPVHVAVILMGLNDQRAAKADGRWQKWGDPGWADAYGKNVERLIKKLKAADVAIYWVGLPVMARAGANEAVETMNNVVREKCYLNGVRYIESANRFTDQFGAYAIYGPDITGQQKRLRAADGIHFTFAGYRKLASYVDAVIRRDLAAARRERNIPLAGNEAEQAKISRSRLAAEAAGKHKTKAAAADAGAGAPAGAKPDTVGGKSQPAAQQGGLTEAAKQRSANLSHAAGRPSLHGVSTAEALGAGASAGSTPQGELIAGDIKSGVTSLATVSSFYDMSLKIAQRRTPLAERTYYKVLVKGESLKPKAGRTDDFRWPRS